MARTWSIGLVKIAFQRASPLDCDQHPARLAARALAQDDHPVEGGVDALGIESLADLA